MFPPQSEHKEVAAWVLLLRGNGNELDQHEQTRTGAKPGMQNWALLAASLFSLGGCVSATIPLPQSEGAPSGS